MRALVLIRYGEIRDLRLFITTTGAVNVDLDSLPEQINFLLFGQANQLVLKEVELSYDQFKVRAAGDLISYLVQSVLYTNGNRVTDKVRIDFLGLD